MDVPKDLAAHGERLATALHDVLLAVRELCSFALEQDGRWSSANNQRKYRVSQLYSSLLDTIRSDALRDPAHLRNVAAAATTPLARDACACRRSCPHHNASRLVSRCVSCCMGGNAFPPWFPGWK